MKLVTLYEECATISDRYLHLQFQLKWHVHCSYFLVDCNQDLTLILLHPSDPTALDVVSVRSQWSRLQLNIHYKRRDLRFSLCCTVEVYMTSYSIDVVQQLNQEVNSMSH